MRLTDEEFEQLVQQAIKSLPKKFLQKMRNLSVEIQPRPTRGMARELDIDDWQDLLGLYVGVPLTEQHVDSFTFPEAIYIFQRNIEDMCDTREQIVEEIRLTVLHEIAHHFGWDDESLDEMGY